MNHIRIPIKANLFISLINAIGIYDSMKIETFIVSWLNVQKANTLGCLLLFIRRIYFLCSFFSHDVYSKNTKPSLSNDSFSTCIVSSRYINLNNIALGIRSSIMGIPYLLISIVSFRISFACLIIGQKIGHSNLVDTCKKYFEFLSSILLTVPAIYEFLIYR